MHGKNIIYMKKIPGLCNVCKQTFNVYSEGYGRDWGSVWLCYACDDFTDEVFKNLPSNPVLFKWII